MYFIHCSCMTRYTSFSDQNQEFGNRYHQVKSVFPLVILLGVVLCAANTEEEDGEFTSHNLHNPSETDSLNFSSYPVHAPSTPQQRVS
jgi:hypothetical protein